MNDWLMFVCIALIVVGVLVSLFNHPSDRDGESEVIKLHRERLIGLAIAVLASSALLLYLPYAVIMDPEGNLTSDSARNGLGGFSVLMVTFALAYAVSTAFQALSRDDAARGKWLASLATIFAFTGVILSVLTIIVVQNYYKTDEGTFDKVDTYELYATQNGNIVKSTTEGEFYGGFLSGTSGTLNGKSETIDVIEYQYGEGDGGVRIGTVPRGDKYTVIYYDATDGNAYLEVETTCTTIEFANTDMYEDSKRTTCKNDPMDRKYEFHLPEGTEEYAWKVFE